METSPAFSEGKSECRVRVFLESGFCTGRSPGPSPSPSPVRVSQYAVTTGSHRMLPSMNKKRRGCTAVIIDDNIVMMGGSGDDFKALNSVECYNFDTNTWTEFPAMIKARGFATAVVKCR